MFMYKHVFNVVLLYFVRYIIGVKLMLVYTFLMLIMFYFCDGRRLQNDSIEVQSLLGLSWIQTKSTQLKFKFTRFSFDSN